MRIFISLLFVLVLGVGIGAGIKMFQPLPAGEETRKVAYWVAQMDPNYRQDKPGLSPMGMDLVPVYEDELNGTAQVSGSALKIDPGFVQTLGVRTAEVSSYKFGQTIRAFGEIVPSTRNEVVIDMRAEGWIVDLATDATGDTVEKGDLLFTYYSPDLMTMQSDYLIGKRIGNAEQRLRLYGMDDKAITALKKNGRFLEATPFHAPIDGTVVTLNVRKGSFVKEGDLALSMQDFSQVWVNADVPVRDLQFLSEGQKVRIIVPETGKEYESSIDFIHHVADPQSRTGIVRLVLQHEHGEPKPGTFVDAVFDADIKPRLAVPKEAVLYSADGAHVFESLGEGRFNPLMVETGITADGLTEIKSGLEAGQKIVTSGQFLLDAETNLKGGMAAMGHDHGH